MTDTATSPAPMWEPGDPLYAHPAAREHDEGNYVRELFQIIDEDVYHVRRFYNDYSLLNTVEVRCIPCLVSWAPKAGPNCWMCGEPGANYDAACTYLENEMRRNGARLVGGPRDGQYLHLRVEGDRIVFPVYVRQDFPNAPLDEATATEATVTYIRDHYDTVTHRWVYTYQEET